MQPTKGLFTTRSGQTARIYGPSRHHPDRWAGNVAGSYTVYEWLADGKSVTTDRYDLIEQAPDSWAELTPSVRQHTSGFQIVKSVWGGEPCDVGSFWKVLDPSGAVVALNLYSRRTAELTAKRAGA